MRCETLRCCQESLFSEELCEDWSEEVVGDVRHRKVDVEATDGGSSKLEIVCLVITFMEVNDLKVEEELSTQKNNDISGGRFVGGSRRRGGSGSLVYKDGNMWEELHGLSCTKLVIWALSSRSGTRAGQM